MSEAGGAISPAQAGRLLWRCRRGTKELDVLLQRYLRQRYPAADTAERDAFERLLELQDPELQDYLSGYREPPDACLREVIRGILATEI